MTWYVLLYKWGEKKKKKKKKKKEEKKERSRMVFGFIWKTEKKDEHWRVKWYKYVSLCGTLKRKYQLFNSLNCVGDEKRPVIAY